MFLIIAIIIAFIVFLLLYKKNIEGYGSPSGAALLQLVAKGPQDSYLTGDTNKYWDYYGFNNYPNISYYRSVNDSPVYRNIVEGEVRNIENNELLQPYNYNY